MITPRFEVQHTGKPYAIGVKIPEYEWKKYTQHTLLSKARSSRDEAYNEMTRRCGMSAWDDHFRIVALEDTVVYYKLHCRGVKNWEGHRTPCGKEITVIGTWPKGAAEPTIYEIGALPEDWNATTQCMSCYMQESARPPYDDERARQRARLGGQGLQF
jgi:hypothetical protein